MPELRPYQLKAIHDLRISLSNKGKRIIMVAPCGAGKTILGVQMIKSVLERGKKVIFLVDRIILANQTSEALDKFGIRHGIIQADNPRFAPDELCQIASGATLMNRKMPDDIALVIQDEAHCKSAALERLEAYNKEAYFCGFTATPYAKGMAKFWDGVVVATTAQELTDSGHLVPMVYYAKAMPDLTNVKIVAGEFQNKSLAEATDKPELTGDVVKNWMQHGEDRQTIVFGVNIAHCKHIAQSFRKRGINAEHIDAYTPTEERQRMLDGFNSCEIRILISVAVLSVGFNATIASCIVMACATKSLIKWHQCAGRGARTHEGKSDCIVFDHAGCCERLGFTTDEQDYTLDDGSRKKQSKAKERDAPLPKACPKCTFIKPAGVQVCPKCSFKPELVRDVEFEKGDLVKVQRKTNRTATKADKQAFYSGLLTYADQHGHKEGFAAHKYKAKMGVWPNAMEKVRGKITDEVKGWIQHEAIARRYK